MDRISSRITPVSLTIIQSVTATISTIRITRNTTRVCGQVASDIFTAERGPSLGSVFGTTCSVIETPNYSADRELLRRGYAAKFNSKRVGRCMMHHFPVQRQSVFLVNQQQSEPIAHPDIWAGGQVADAQTAKTYV